ncbi:MAG TPA: ABC transporter substrate-binding protein [Acetobacteraceae bacterium]
MLTRASCNRIAGVLTLLGVAGPAITLGVPLPAMAQSAAPASDRVLHVVPSADLAELDPTRGANQIARIYSQMVFDTLFALDHELVPKPMMVDTETVSPDRLTYRFTLRPDLRFQDGSPVTTRDVIASLERWMQGGSIGPALKARLASMTADDDRTFTMVLKEPFGLLEFALAGPGAPIAAIMREADAKRGNTPMTAPIGSGPFRYVAEERQSGNLSVFVRNPDYPSRPEPPDGLAGGRVVKVDRVEWKVIPDATTAANALVTGEVDFWDTVTPDLAQFLKSKGVIVRRTATLPMTAWIRPNFTTPPFDKPEARQALALLLDQTEMMQAVAGENGKFSTCYSFSVCGSTYATDVGSDAYRKPDIAKAKALMKKAGYKGEPIVVISSSQLPIVSAMAQVVAQRLKDAGLNVDLQDGDWANQYKRVNTRMAPGAPGQWQIFPSYALGGTWFNPLTNVALDTSCGASSTAILGWPCDPEGETLRQKVLSAPDAAARTAAFATFQKRLWDFLPYIPAGQFDVANAYRKNIDGVLDSYVIAYWNISKH